jgi:hypothetical protein
MNEQFAAGNETYQREVRVVRYPPIPLSSDFRGYRNELVSLDYRTLWARSQVTMRLL